MNATPSPQGLLFDLDGVLYVGKEVIFGAIATIAELREQFTCRFITNTSTLSLASLQHKINALGFDIASEEIISAPQAALRYLEQQPDPTCRLLLAEDVKRDFAAVPQSDTAPRFIVVGDIGNAWSYALLNEIFAALMQGARLIAVHKNRFWQTEHGLQLDIGAFIHGLEYAAGAEAVIIGKPSPAFFQVALDDMGLKKEEVLMIGDDIDSDIGGAQQAGLRAVLVKTGKYRDAYVSASAIKPEHIIESIADLPALLETLAGNEWTGSKF
jgi:HAD superfamily hydrolase (TIGR01458 family)